jgi:hypothetical protein
MLKSPADAQRNSRLWEFTEYRTLELIPNRLLASSGVKPHNEYEEIVHDGKADFKNFTLSVPKTLKGSRREPKEGVSRPELPGLAIRLAHSVPREYMCCEQSPSSLAVSYNGQKAPITSTDAAETLEVGAGNECEGSNVVFGFDQDASPAAGAPAPIAAPIRVLPRSVLIHMAHDADREGWKTGMVTGMTEAEEEATAGDLWD